MAAIILNTTTKKLVAVLAGAVTTTQLPFTVHYADATDSALTEAETDGATNSTTQVDLVSAPAASTRRAIVHISVANVDTAAATITISLDNNGTLRRLVKVTLAIGDTLQFNAGAWSVIDTNGQIKSGASAGITDGDKGDITVTSSGATWTIDNNAVTFAKMQAITDGKLLGASGGTAIEEITVGSGLTLSSNTLTASGTGGSNSICDGRLTLASGTPVVTTNQTAKTTVYFTPYIGKYIALYNGSTWDVIGFTEISVSVPSTTNTPFDIFCYSNSGTATLETVNWTNDTTRATALTYQDGVYVKSGATTRRYLGTGRTTGSSGQCEMSFGGSGAGGVEAKLYLWNYYNRVNVVANVFDTTDTWTYSTASWRSMNNSTANRISIINGVNEYPYNTILTMTGTGGTCIAIGLDSTSTPATLTALQYNGNGNPDTMTAANEILTGVGYHYIQALEYQHTGAAVTGTYYGDGATSFIRQSLQLSGGM